MEEVVEKIIKCLIEKINMNVSISSIYLYMGTMVIKSKRVLLSQRRILDTRLKRKENIINMNIIVII